MKIKLEGRKYSITNDGWSKFANISAIGARIILHLQDRDLMREVIGGTGHGNMQPLQLHFGLNSNLSATGMTIYWPSRNEENNQRKIIYVNGPIEANNSYTFVEDIGFVGKKGDINDDDLVNVQDIIVSVNYVVTDKSPEISLFWAGDMNYDNILNVLDVIRIVNFILN
tara:strand:- start:191 stop:697 length:507 start_codon:yes stop_codon:yes gene_type:complete